MSDSIWSQCRGRLQGALTSQQFNTWIQPLTAAVVDDTLVLQAPNRFIGDFVADKYSSLITEVLGDLHSQAVSADGGGLHVAGRPVRLQIGTPATLAAAQACGDAVPGKEYSANKGGASPAGGQPQPPVIRGPALSVVGGHAEAQLNSNTGEADRSTVSGAASGTAADAEPTRRSLVDSTLHYGQAAKSEVHEALQHQHNLVSGYTFDTFVEGKSNQLALAAANQVAENPGGAYNPLFLYGGVGLGKTHLMHAVGNALKMNRPDARIVYLHSERFVADMVKALQLNAISDFKRYYRSVDALLIDDIQFFAKKDRSQEEFFHTFNALLESGQQMILTCDRYPKEIEGLEERLKSRFGWGLTVAVEPPDLETRVAILMNKATQARLDLPNDAAFFIAQRIRSNVRELEGALKRVLASANFTRRPITVELVKESLKDLLALQDKQVSLDNIQRTVAEYYKIKVADLNSRRRNRSVARPRQVAMALAKELTNYSLPEIGDSFGGRDHTTVLHACRKIKELRETSSDIHEDYKNLLRLLTT